MLLRGHCRRLAAHMKGSSAALCRRSYATGLRRTALHGLHVSLGAKMVPFCGWDMPVQYGDGIIKSHEHVRSASGLFDVSHMLQLRFTGADRVGFVESLCVGDLAELAPGHGRLSLLTNPWGGIIDDTVITNNEDHLYVVVNAGCADKDLEHLQEALDGLSGAYDVRMEQLSESRSLLALQGPTAAQTLAALLPAAEAATMDSWAFMTSRTLPLADGRFDAYITRCGYTGEDGFEISVLHEDAEPLATVLLEQEGVMPAGLGARDTLRTEAGLCLYGNDIDEDTTPCEASLQWTIGKRRRQEANFLGAEKILEQLSKPSLVRKKRVGIMGARVPQPHSPILSSAGDVVGEVTTGTFSPLLKKGVGMAYINKPHHKLGTEVFVEARGGKKLPLTVTRMPFVPTNYHQVACSH